METLVGGDRVDLRMMEYACAVYRQGSVTKAAEVLCVAQPSLSQQLAKLEDELRVVLFVRGRGGAVPTAHGERFVEQAEHILRLQEDLVREMRERSQGMGSELVVGAPAITGGRVLPPIISAFHERYPATRVRLIEETTEELERLAARGETDLCLLALPIREDRLTTIPLFTEALYLVVPLKVTGEWERGVASGVDDSLGVALKTYAKAPFILLKHGYGFRQTVLALCAESGFQPDVAYETSSIETAQTLVAHGLGVTIVPALVRRQGGQGPVYYRLDPPATRTLVFAYHKDRYLGLAARAFLQVYREVKPSW